MAQRRRSSKGKEKKDEFEYIDRESEDISDDQSLQRKRSQVEIRSKEQRKKQDVKVVAIACIIIIGLLIAYYYFMFISSSKSTDVDEDKTEGIYDSELFVISDITHDWNKTSWHIMNIKGKTNFLLKVQNTGDNEDEYELRDNNKLPNIKIKYSKNLFTLQPGRSTIVILNISNTITQEFRVPNPINIQLKSLSLKTIMDSVNINLTIDILNPEEITINGDKVSAYYTGSFENGTLFDYSLRDPANTDPLRISLIQDEIQYGGLESLQYAPVIEGFRRGLISMLPGETSVVVVPPELGYPSDHELGDYILIFEVRLLSNDRNI